MRTLYPQLTADPALLTDFFQESVVAHTLYGSPLASDTCGIQLAKAAGCLIEELQRNAGEEITIDNNMSQSDLLFVLPDASANRLFASDLFPVYLNKNEFVQTCPQLIAMSFDLLHFPPPELGKNRSTQTWSAYTAPRRQLAAMEAQRTLRLAAFQQSPVFQRDFVIQHSMFDMPRPARAAEPMKQSDFVRKAGQEMVAAFRALTNAAQTALSASAAPPRNILTATHQFTAPPTLLQPRLNMLPPLPIDPYALYSETAMFQWAEQ